VDSGWLGYPGYSEAGTGRYKGTRTKEEQARQVVARSARSCQRHLKNDMN